VRVKKNSNLLYEFYKTPFCCMRFLEHEERYKANKCDKMTYKTSVIQYFFYFAHIFNFKLKKIQNTMPGKLYLGKYKGLVTLVTKRTIASFEFSIMNYVATTHCESLPTLKI
jgi:hypothetical protein